MAETRTEVRGLRTEFPREGRTHAEIIEELQASASASREVENRVSAPPAPSLLAGLDAGTYPYEGAVATTAAPPPHSVRHRRGPIEPGANRTAFPDASAAPRDGSIGPRRGRPMPAEETASLQVADSVCETAGVAPNATHIGGDPAAVKPVQPIARQSYRGTPVPGAGMEQERLASLISSKSPGASPGPASTESTPPRPVRKPGGRVRRFRAKAIAPAPWSVDRSAGVWFVVGADGRAIASVIPRGEKTKATADLMSAGPVMLAAIELVADGLDGLVREMPGDHRLREAVAALRAVQDIAYGVGDPLA